VLIFVLIPVEIRESVDPYHYLLGFSLPFVVVMQMGFSLFMQ
jgi:hypothetical protein